jgi:hypothetical protein
MRFRAPALAPCLAPRSGGVRAAVHGRRLALGSGGSLLGRRRLLGDGPPVRLLADRIELLLEPGILPALELGLPLLEDGEEGRRDEDRGEGARADADQQREGELLQRVAAEEDERRDRQERDEARRE